MQKAKHILLASTLLFTSLYATKPTLPEILDPKTTSPQHPQFHRQGPTVQIGILLDTSGSMSGLINQAKDQLWKIVNEVAKANRNHKDVIIEVGLFEYGKATLPGYEGYLQMLSPLTSDLDKVSDELFRLRTNGGEEYAGKVILEAVNRFAWSTHKDDLKLLIIAGNEPFTQGNVPYEEAIKKARRNDIIVNTIFCGDAHQGKRGKWEDGARRGDGKYFNINHNDRRRYIPTPYDDDIIALGKKLNHTYLNYGNRAIREAKVANTRKQDANAESLSKSSYIERNIVKSKKQYTSTSSDMVSAYMENPASIEKIDKNLLPDILKGKSKKEIKHIIEQKKEQRVTLQKQIRALEAKRDKFIVSKSSKQDNNLGAAIIKSIREQATQKGFTFSK